ncbi:hypothetical protein FWF74_00830 [Candidatus Saccharibacteria bacterium]|nr:hypothetical protein [Candidatus Saccharibacteria bacterium]MCL1963281.1 hypothetical protein [Candidatus Saccharibacteria bacterium]
MNSQSNSGTGLRKRELIESTGKQVIMWAAIAAMALTVGLMISINFIQRIQYSFRVNGELGKTVDTLKENIGEEDSINDPSNHSNIKELIANADKLTQNDKLLSMRSSNVNDTVFQVIIDALPMECNSVETSASMAIMVQRVNNVQAQDNGTAVTVTRCGNSGVMEVPVDTGDGTGTATTTGDFKMPTKQNMTFVIDVTGSYDSVQELLKAIEKTIRPITINSMSFSGSNGKLQVTINATTYYLPKVNYQLGSKEIKPNEE